MPPVEVEHLVDDGDTIKVGDLELEVWHTPGHTDSQLSFRLGNLLFSGDNIYRDGCVGAIDAHHGSDIPAFVKSLRANPRQRRRVAAAQPRSRSFARTTNCWIERSPGSKATRTWPTSAPARSIGR